MDQRPVVWFRNGVVVARAAEGAGAGLHRPATKHVPRQPEGALFLRNPALPAGAKGHTPDARVASRRRLRRGFVRVFDTFDVGEAPQAWKTLGENLDGLSFPTVTSPGHCKPAPGAKPSNVIVDGVDGIDNAFSRNIVPLLPDLDSSMIAKLQMAPPTGRHSYFVALATTEACAPSRVQRVARSRLGGVQRMARERRCRARFQTNFPLAHATHPHARMALRAWLGRMMVVGVMACSFACSGTGTEDDPDPVRSSARASRRQAETRGCARASARKPG